MELQWLKLWPIQLLPDHHFHTRSLLPQTSAQREHTPSLLSLQFPVIPFLAMTLLQLLFTTDHMFLQNASTSYVMGFEDNEDLSTWATEDVNIDGYFWNLVTTNPHSGSVCARIWLLQMLQQALMTLACLLLCLELNDSTNYDLSYYYRTSVLLPGESDSDDGYRSEFPERWLPHWSHLMW